MSKEVLYIIMIACGVGSILALGYAQYHLYKAKKHFDNAQYHFRNTQYFCAMYDSTARHGIIKIAATFLLRFTEEPRSMPIVLSSHMPTIMSE